MERFTAWRALFVCSVLLATAGGIPLACAYTGSDVNLIDRDVRLTILHTSDIHSRILPFEYVPMYTERQLGLVEDRAPFGGLAEVAAIVKREREKAGRSLWLDSGDVFQGAPIFNLFHGEPEVRGLSEARLDAFAIGNHEFDAGPENAAEQFAAWATFPVLNANYRWLVDKPHTAQMKKMVAPYIVRNLNGLRVAIIGLGNTSSMYSLDKPDNSLGAVAIEPVALTQELVDEVRGDADVVLLLSHMGLNDDYRLARSVCGIDAIMGGHHHIALDPPTIVPYGPEESDLRGVIDYQARESCLGHTTIVSHPQAFAKFVGRLDLIVRNGQIKSHAYELIPVDNTTPRDPEVWGIIEPYYIELAHTLDLDRVLGEALIDLARFGVGGGDSALGNFVAEAMQFRPGVETDFCVTNSLGIRVDVQQGDILLDDLYNVLPFDNTIATMYLSGVEVQELLDYATQRSAERGCSTQIQVSGLTFTMNCREGAAQDIYIGGRPLNYGSVYEMATNNYMAAGGSGFTMLARNTTQHDTGISMRTAVIDYLSRHPRLPECDQDVPDLALCRDGIAVEDGRIKTVY